MMLSTNPIFRVYHANVPNEVKLVFFNAGEAPDGVTSNMADENTYSKGGSDYGVEIQKSLLSTLPESYNYLNYSATETFIWSDLCKGYGK